MQSKLLSQRATAAASAIALAAMTVLAACDSDRAVSPNPSAKVPTSAEAAWTPTPATYIGSGYIDMNHNPVGGGVMLLRDSAGTPLSLVADGGPGDYDNRLGEISFKVPKPGTFQVCFASAPTGFALPYNTVPCIGSTVKAGWDLHIDEFTLVPAPSVVIRVLDDANGLSIGPSTFTISSPRMPNPIVVVDNGMNDLYPANIGSMLVKVPAAGTYNICQTVAPFNYYLAKQACRTVDVTSGGNVLGGYFWNVRKPTRP